MKFFWSIFFIMTALFNTVAEVYQEKNSAALSQLAYRELVSVNLVQHPWQFAFSEVPADYYARVSDTDVITFDGFDDGRTFNLDQILPKKPAALAEGVLYITFDAPRDGVTNLGISCDWWCEVYLNNVLCFTTFPAGNGFGDRFTCEDHPFLAPVKKGRNLLAIKVKRGAVSWNFSLGKVLPQFPVQVQLAAGPFLLYPDAGSISVLFRTAGKLPAGVQYRISGSQEWQKVYDQRSNQLVARELHNVALNDLQQGAVYEYQIIMRDPADHGREITDKRIGKFKVPDLQSTDCTFLFVADTQFNPKVQKDYLSKLFKHADAENCDFIVFGGDMAHVFMPGNYDQVLLAALPADKPLVMVRGNHELRGSNSADYLDYFAWRNNRTYGMFRWGDTAFLVLDTVGKSDPKRPEKNERALILPNLFEEQKKFIAETVRSPYWQQAKKRIILAHAAPYTHNLKDQLTAIAQDLTDRFFAGKTPESSLDMYLTGHVHKYLRSIPASSRIASYNKLPWQISNSSAYNYPVITAAGPDPTEPVDCSIFQVKSSDGKLVLKVFSTDGRIIEHIEYYSDGKTIEKQTINQFEY